MLNDLASSYAQEPDKISNYTELSSNEEPPALETIPPIFQKTQIKSPSLSSNMFSALIEEEEEQTQPCLASTMVPVPIVEPIEATNVVTPAKRGKKPRQTASERNRTAEERNRIVEEQIMELGEKPTEDPKLNKKLLKEYTKEQKDRYNQTISKTYKKRVSKKNNNIMYNG